MTKLTKGPGVMVALDMPDVEQALHVCHVLERASGTFCIKVGRPLEMVGGAAILKEIRENTRLPVVYDGKIADVPHVATSIAERAFEAGADGVIVHGFCGSDVLKAVMELSMGDVICVVEMSHSGAQEFYKGASERIVRMAAELEVHGVVLPATHPERIRTLSKHIPAHTYIISPGVGAQGGVAGMAIANGAHWEVVGRAITLSDDILSSAEEHYRACIASHRNAGVP